MSYKLEDAEKNHIYRNFQPKRGGIELVETQHADHLKVAVTGREMSIFNSTEESDIIFFARNNAEGFVGSWNLVKVDNGIASGHVAISTSQETTLRRTVESDAVVPARTITKRSTLQPSASC